jgi:hypothetical protein
MWRIKQENMNKEENRKKLRKKMELYEGISKSFRTGRLE